MSSSGPLTFDSGLNSVSPSHSVSDSHLSSSQTQSKLNGESGVNMSPHPVNLLRRRNNDGNGSVACTIQRSVLQDASHASSSSQLDDDLQFSYGRETASASSDKSGSNEQLDEGFRPLVQQVANPKEQYEFMRHPTKPRAESAPAAPVNTSNYVHMNPRPTSDCKTTPSTKLSNYINVIPTDMKAPVENYENTGFNSMRVSIPSKGTTENLATIQEGVPSSMYENHSLPDSTYVNNSIKPTPAEQYENTSPNFTAIISSCEQLSKCPPQCYPE